MALGTSLMVLHNWVLAALAHTCMIMYSRPFHHFMWPVHISAKETAGLRWAPDTLAKA